MVKKSERTWKDLGLWAVVVYGLLLAVFCAYFSVFDLGFSFYQIAAVSGLSIPIPLILVWSEKHRKKKIVAAVFVIILAIIIFNGKIYQGIVPHMNCYIQLYNKYYLKSNPIIVAEKDLSSEWLVLFLLGSIISILFFLVLSTKKGLVSSIIIVLIPVILAATVGKMPETWCGCILILMTCCYVTVYHQKKGMFSVITVLIGLFAVAFFVQPLISAYKEANMEAYQNIKTSIVKAQQEQRLSFSEIQEKTTELSDLVSIYKGGGISKGELESLTSFKPSGEKAMEVIVTEQPTSAVYLKGYVGSTYTGSEWKELGTLEFVDMISPIGGGDERRELMSETFRRITEGTDTTSIEQMEIVLENASSEFGYSPYYAEITEDYDVYLDAYVKGGWGKTREYSYISQKFFQNLWLSSISDELAEASDLWIQYQDFVKETYIESYPELEELSDLCSTLDKDSADVVAEEINDLFRWNYRYSREPGEMPEDMDFAEGFLFKKKVGFCVHFATSATLIYRMCGIPARYVEGYMISADQFEPQGDGTFKAVVTDSSAHAWCETFDKEYGWQVREHTLSYNGDTIENLAATNDEIVDDPIENEVENESQIESETEENSQQVPQVETENENLSGGLIKGDGTAAETSDTLKMMKEVMKKVLLCMGSCLVLIAIVILQQKIRRAKKLKNFRRKKGNQGIINIYNEIYDMCSFSGFKTTEEEWNRIYDCAEKAKFSAKVFSAEEQKEMYHLYRGFRKEILKSLNWRKKLWFLYVKCH